MKYKIGKGSRYNGKGKIRGGRNKRGRGERSKESKGSVENQGGR